MAGQTSVIMQSSLLANERTMPYVPKFSGISFGVATSAVDGEELGECQWEKSSNMVYLYTSLKEEAGVEVELKLTKDSNVSAKGKMTNYMQADITEDETVLALVEKLDEAMETFDGYFDEGKHPVQVETVQGDDGEESTVLLNFKVDADKEDSMDVRGAVSEGAIVTGTLVFRLYEMNGKKGVTAKLKEVEVKFMRGQDARAKRRRRK